MMRLIKHKTKTITIKVVTDNKVDRAVLYKIQDVIESKFYKDMSNVVGVYYLHYENRNGVSISIAGKPSRQFINMIIDTVLSILQQNNIQVKVIYVYYTYTKCTVLMPLSQR